jgi:DNA invertase Pin-like site-specific DNA recombinase
MAPGIVRQLQSDPSVLRAAIYARVSTMNNGQDPTMQTRELREYCDRRGWNVVAEFVDIGISGAKDGRPQLDRLMADARRRKFDLVAVWRFDRFARSVRHLLRALDEFQALRIDFVSLSESVDTSTPAGRMVFTVLGAVAELERSLIAERVRAGLRNARARGVRLGRPKALGDPDKILALRGSGASWRAIGRELGLSAETARKIAHSRSKNPSGAFVASITDVDVPEKRRKAVHAGASTALVNFAEPSSPQPGHPYPTALDRDRQAGADPIRG